MCASGTAAVAYAAQPAAITGIVRDAQGVPQMGALVQVINVQALTTEAALAGTAFTDMHGRYRIINVPSGKYQLKATAALFLPALRDDLQLRPGAQAVVNLTLNTLFEAVEWLPAQRRRADEPEDDWKWTLRSAANRPILRMLEDGPLVMVSSSSNEQAQPSLQARVALTSGEGGFGQGGLHNIFTLDRVLEDGSGVILRADLASPQETRQVGPSADITAGYQRRLNPGTAVRSVVSYQEHPEVIGRPGVPGLQTLTLQSAQEMQLGDMVAIEVGSEMAMLRMDQTTIALHPFGKLTVHPTNSLVVSYRAATARDLQSWDDMDTVRPELADVVPNVHDNGKAGLRTEQGFHQELSIGRRTGRGLLQAALYQDRLTNTAVSGGGLLTGAELAQGGVQADPSTASFRMLGPGYVSNGFRLSAEEPIAGPVLAMLEYTVGDALAMPGFAEYSSFSQRMDHGGTVAGGQDLARAAALLRVQQSEAVTLALHGQFNTPGTRVRASYRWQPLSTVTAVDSYDAYSDQPYLSFYVRQPLRFGRILPNGVEALVEVTNLLAQGYHPVISSDGRTLFFAQAPRALRGGLSFSF